MTDDSKHESLPGVQPPSHVATPKLEVLNRVAGVAGIESLKKTVLLVDSDLRSREARAKAMRSLGVAVDSVACAETARVRLANEQYNLILVDLGRDNLAAESLVNEIRTRNSRQLVRFLVGRPLYVAKSLNGGNASSEGYTPVPPTARRSRRKPLTPVVSTLDFGQRIRAAEAEETTE